MPTACRLSRTVAAWIYRAGFLAIGWAAAAGSTVGAQTTAAAGLPLTPTRAIRFTTDEGTWMSVDVSPDGRTIVLDLLGDLYTLPIAGGTATRITSGMAFDVQPRFSPDGRHLVFVSDRDGWMNVWVADRDGRNPRQVTRYRYYWGGWSGVYDRVASPEWTPDGRAVVVIERAEDYGGPAAQTLVEYDVASGTPTRLTVNGPGSRRQFYGPAFGRDPEVVYASVDDWVSSEFAFTRLSRIVRVNRVTRHIGDVTSTDGRLSAMRPVVSPDGRYLVYGSRTGDGTGLRLRHLATDEEQWLLPTGHQDLGDWVNVSRDLLPGSAFTPDAKALVTSFGGKLWRIEVPSGRRTSIPFRVEVEQLLGPLVRFARRQSVEDTLLSVRRILQPAVSPDGSRVVFSALDRLWIAELPRPRGSAAGDTITTIVPRRLTKGGPGEYFPAWAPSGEHVVFATWSAAEGGALYRLRVPAVGAADPGTPERLTPDRGVFYAKVSYSPDGQFLVALRGPTRAFHERGLNSMRGPALSTPTQLDLVRLPAGGGTPVRIAPYLMQPGDAGLRVLASGRLQVVPGVTTPRMSIYVPGGEVLAFALDADPGTLAHADTIARFAPDPVGGQNPIEALASPDGRHLLVQLPEAVSLGWAYLTTLLEQPLGTPISFAPDSSAPPGARINKLGTSGAHFVGWTARGVPFYTLANTLFLGDRPPSAAGHDTVRFRRFDLKLQVPRQRVRGTVLLRGARLLTMRGREVIESGDLLVRDGRIAALGPSGTVPVPADALVLDGRGKTVVPGYVDVHDHVWRSIHWGIHADPEWRLVVDLAFGVTTLRDPTGFSLELSGLGEREAAGDLLAPRIFSVDGALTSAPLGDGTHHTLDFIRTLLRRWSDFLHDDQVKVYGAGGRRTRQLIAMAARELGLQPTLEGGYNSNTDLTMALDGFAGVEHTLPEVPYYRDVVQLYVQSGIIETSTFAVAPVNAAKSVMRGQRLWSDPKFRRFVPPEVADQLAAHHEISGTASLARGKEVAAQAAKIMAAGGCVAMGSHGDIPGYGAHIELWLYALGGMPHYDALRAATICAARALGRESDFGSLGVGKLADLQVLEANPLTDIRNTLKIRYVMKQGVLWEASTMDQLWPTRKPFRVP